MLIAARNGLISLGYRALVKPIAFRQDPEAVHERFTTAGQFLGRHGLMRAAVAGLLNYSHPMLAQELHGIRFPNPLGLAAGFDKDAQLTDIIPSVGFGFEEVGSITGDPCEGNPKPRLWRIPTKQSIRVWYGLKNKGCVALAEELKHRIHRIPLGISIAKTNCRETVGVEAGIKDYAKAFKTLEPYADYLTVNISCPNAFGGLPFEDVDRLAQLLTALDRIETEKPVFLKFSPDLPDKQRAGLIAVAKKHRVQGFICTNLTKNGVAKGGLSGGAVREKSLHVLKQMHELTDEKFTIISCGGIFTADDAYYRIRHGASLLQLITGMIYLGPQVVSEINHGLVKRLKADGFNSIGEAVGTAYKR